MKAEQEETLPELFKSIVVKDLETINIKNPNG